MFDGLMTWLCGWRVDADGWLVRARLPSDPDLTGLDRSDIGFIEEASIAVRTRRYARMVDLGFFKNGDLT